MADGELERRNGGSRPVPDPTLLTDQAIAKADKSLREWVTALLEIRDERLRGIDEATKLRLAGIESIPRQIREAVTSLELLQDEKFNSIQTQFRERDIRAEREARDNKVAVDAAFAAQKEAAAKQDEGNAKAIDKSEKATAETIKTNQELSRSVTDGLTKDVDSLKLGVNAIQSTKVGAIETRASSSQNYLLIAALAGLLISLVVAVIAVIALLTR